MSSSSSDGTLFRAVVMLGVLGAGGYWAAKNTPIVDIALRQFDAWQKSQQPAHTSRDEGGDAPAFNGGSAASGQAGNPGDPAAPLNPFSASPIMTGVAPGRAAENRPQPGLLPPPVSAVPIQRPGVYSSGAEWQQGAIAINPAPQGAPGSVSTSSTVQQAEFQRAAGSDSLPAGGSQSLTDLDAQLARLGAVYTLLEHWGHEGPRYRFHCKVALAGGSAETRRFEAVGDDPLQLMRQVIEQIAAWRAGRQP